MSLKTALEELRRVALAYPETVEESPWGERGVKVRRKVFVFLSMYQGRLSITTKLPKSGVSPRLGANRP